MKKGRILLIAIVLVGVIFGGYKIHTGTRNAVDQLTADKQLINVLICGGNRFNDNKHRFYSILSINPVTKATGVIFLPPAYEIDLEDDGNGVKLEDVDIRDFSDISRAISKSLKLKCQFYAVLYSPDVRKDVDVADGIELFLQEPLAAIFGSHFGMNYFDGSKTVEFINSDSSSIYAKYDRIQDIIFTLFDARKKYLPLLNRPMVSELKKTIKTNLLSNEIISLGKLIGDSEKIQCSNLPGRLSEEGIFYVDEVAFRIYEDSYLRWLFVDEKKQPNIRVRILNATDVSGLAKKTRNMLMREGISVVEFGTSPISNLEKSLIINNKGTVEDLKLISELTDIKEIRHSVDSTQMHDATILIGKDMAK